MRTGRKTSRTPAIAVDGLLSKLERLRALDGELQGFGAFDHEYRLRPRLSVAKLEMFQTLHGVRLPADYVAFLQHAGNGGAGPGCGLTPLRAWKPELVLVTKYVEFVDDRPVVIDGKVAIVDLGPRPSLRRRADPSRPFLLEGPWPPRENDRLPGRNVHPFDGCTHLCEDGDGYATFLVVTGQRAGEVWSDHTHGVAFGAVFPRAPSFLAWYDAWLDQAIATARGGRPPT